MPFHQLWIVAALVCFILSATNVGGKINWTSAGFACLAASLLV